jgi:hypothetical protein
VRAHLILRGKQARVRRRLGRLRVARSGRGMDNTGDARLSRKAGLRHDTARSAWEA